jgi:hypothetical protein
MTWTEIKRWAKDKGYNAEKRGDCYFWSRLEDQSICGNAASVSKVATAIFNNMTENRFIAHQQGYKNHE